MRGYVGVDVSMIEDSYVLILVVVVVVGGGRGEGEGEESGGKSTYC